MRRYVAYGLTIQSEFDLCELRELNPDGAAADVVVRSGEVEPVPADDGHAETRRIAPRADVCRVTYDAVGSFRVSAGRRITVDAASPKVPETKVFRRLLENELMALLLLQRGMLVLHASAVSVNGRGAIFLGDRGAGKSTTATAFHREGHRLLEDDAVAVRFDEEGPVVLPGVPELRLTPDSVDGLGVDDTAVAVDDWGPEKEYKRVEPGDEPAPLAGCYVLQEGSETRLREIPARNRLFVLVSSTYAQGLLRETDALGDHFKQCSRIAEDVSIRRLVRPKEYGRLPDVVDLVAADLRL